jgi:hypothetical protein
MRWSFGGSLLWSEMRLDAPAKIIYVHRAPFSGRNVYQWAISLLMGT